MEQPDTTKQHPCLNCGASLPESAKYCSGCGQKNTNGKISVASVLGEVWSNLVNLDAKIFRTVPALFVPGKLTREFFKGRQRRYMHPFRIFLLSVFV
ncbi:MAG: DUF3667 domain-containing protein, partial [Phaeodactylibacter sp.]|nr:DUF3667 domain-containing protein [Phaeodactylibacter sp.]